MTESPEPVGPNPVGPNPEGERYRERWTSARDGRRLYSRDYGRDATAAGATGLRASRPVLLCLPGLARNSKDFHRFATRQAERGYRSVTLDYRGRGQSDRDSDPGKYVPEVYLDDIHQLLAALNLHRVIVVGTSLGGLLAMAMGAAMPGVLSGVILNDIGPEIPDMGQSRIMEYLERKPELPDMDAAVKDLRSFMGHLPLSDEEWHLAAEGTYRRGAGGKYRYDWDPAITKPLRDGKPIPDLWPLFKTLRHIPVLALRGAVTDLLSEDCFRRMQDAKPDLVRVTIPKAGHVPTLSEPESIEALDGFIDDVAAKTPHPR